MTMKNIQEKHFSRQIQYIFIPYLFYLEEEYYRLFIDLCIACKKFMIILTCDSGSDSVGSQLETSDLRF